KRIYLYPGFCPTHARILPERARQMRKEYPEARLVVHPECRPELIALADEVLSTSGFCRYAGQDDVREMIVGTEIGLIYRLRGEHPGKRFIPLSEQAICPSMKLITLEKVIRCLEKMEARVEVSREVLQPARTAIERMLFLS
ncbi:MAG: quinolinate synthase, partial [Methanobacteriota archaeon]